MTDDVHGTSPSVGQRKTKLHHSAKDLTGQVFGRLTAIDPAPPKIRNDGTPRSRWNCQCSCGKSVVVVTNSLTSGRTKSCGCLMKETVESWRGKTHPGYKHGGRKTKEYLSWARALERTRNKANPSYKNYGGRGIDFSPEWASDFGKFMDDMGPCPDGYTIERIDNNRGYYPDNCKWADRTEQARNRRSTVLIHAFGEAKTVGEWSAITGIPALAIWKRINMRGWDNERAIVTQVKR